MSVSLREKVAEIISKYNVGSPEAGDVELGSHIGDEGVNKLTDQILSLFPAKLTEEEVENVLPKKRTCYVIHEHGKSIDKKGFCAICTGTDFYNQAIDDCKSALIGKCATEQKEYCTCGKDKTEYGELGYCSNCNKPIPAEKKE